MEKQNPNKKINYIKYSLIVLLMSGLWSFLGGLVIALHWPEGHMIGSNVFFWGLLCSYFVFNYLVKKERIPWVLNDISNN